MLYTPPLNTHLPYTGVEIHQSPSSPITGAGYTVFIRIVAAHRIVAALE